MRWEKFLASHARRVYASGPTAKTDTARAIIAKLNTGKLKAGFHAQHVYNSGWADTKDKHITMDALELLVDKGWLRCEENQSPKGARAVCAISQKRVL